LETAFALRRFADSGGALGTPAAWRVRALALSRFADIVPEGLAVRARADAAQAFLEAGIPRRLGHSLRGSPAIQPRR